MCADLALSKLVVTEQGSDKVLHEEHVTKGCKFTLETTERRLLVSAEFEAPSAEEVDSERGTSQYRHRTMLTYSYLTRFFRWQFPLENIQAATVVSAQGTVSKASVTTHRRIWIPFLTGVAVLAFGIPSAVALYGLEYGAGYVLAACAGLTALIGGVLWCWCVKTQVTPKIHQQVDDTVIEISGTSPQDMTGVTVALTVLDARDHIGNIDDFFERVNPDHAPRVSRGPLSEVPHSTHCVQIETIE